MDKVRVLFGNGKETMISRGAKLSQAMETAGIKKEFPCGGIGKCGQCKTEVALLKKDGTKEITTVLACSFSVTEETLVEANDQGRELNPLILTSGSQTISKVDSSVEKRFINVETGPEKINSQWDRLSEKLAEAGAAPEPSLEVLQQYSVLSGPRKEKGLTIVSVDGKITGIEQGDKTGPYYGLAIDVGTTTVVVSLVNLVSGQQAAVGADLNGQRVYGADVISRISAAEKAEGNIYKLQKEVMDTINSVIEKVTSQAGVEPENIYYVTVAGNTCMHHLLLGLDPSGLGRAPFLPVFRQELEISASQIGLTANRNARVWMFPVIAGFIGGDTVSAILATGMHQTTAKSLLVDIGTNGEMVINYNGKMIACSTAAGPALEGAQIECGMRAEDGAVRKVRLTPEVDFEVVGSGYAKGICGSGLIDLLADMVRNNLVNSRGKLAKPEHFKGSEHLRSRLKVDDRGSRFILVHACENGGREIFLSQKDISQVQLAKGAIRASLELLIKSVGIEPDELEEVRVAGAFGNFMDIRNAVVAGLLPHWAEQKIRLVGNAAGEGAIMALLSRHKRLEAADINKNVEFLELAGTARFQEEFVKGMLFSEGFEATQ